MLNLKSEFKKSVKKRYAELLKEKVDPEKAYTQAALEFLKENKKAIKSANSN